MLKKNFVWVMASVIGKLHEFRAEDEEISAYIERVELYFEVNEIDQEKQAVALLTAVSGKTYLLLRNLVAPPLPKEKSFAQLKEILKAHFEPKPLVIAERFRFHQRSQQAIESVQEYVAELKCMAKHCNFRTYLNEALRGRLVCGLRNKAIQKRLLSEAKLTFERAIQIAQGMESAERNCLELHGTEEERLIKLTRSSTLKGPRKPQWTSIKCFRCGGNNHKSEDCRFKDSQCFKCRKVGHIAAVCQGKEATAKSTENQRGGRNTSRRANWLQSEVQPVDGGEDEPDFPMYNLDHVASLLPPKCY